MKWIATIISLEKLERSIKIEEIERKVKKMYLNKEISTPNKFLCDFFCNFQKH